MPLLHARHGAGVNEQCTCLKTGADATLSSWDFESPFTGESAAPDALMGCPD